MIPDHDHKWVEHDEKDLICPYCGGEVSECVPHGPFCCDECHRAW
jgi:endogenous inhibitor of DNA gyrase (YacG/DUF329 family)